MNSTTGQRRRLIVNADDFGLSRAVNHGVFTACDHGIVTSASLMVRQPGAAHAVIGSCDRPRLSVGLHLDLGEWRFTMGNWEPVYEVVPLDEPAAVTAELHAQLGTFRTLLGRDPSHIDSHQHVHRRDGVREIATAFARDLAVPLRHYAPNITYCGLFYGQTAEGTPIPDAIEADALIRILQGLSAGTTELACHPGVAIRDDTMYRHERGSETEVLCNPRVRAFLEAEHIELCSFSPDTSQLLLDR